MPKLKNNPRPNTAPPIPGLPDQHGKLADGMTVLQRKFADEYLALIGDGKNAHGCKQQAAINAGYSPTDAAGAAWRNLRHPVIMAYVAEQLTVAAIKVPIDPSYVLLKSLVAVEMAEKNNDPRAMIRAVEVIAKHKDVLAWARTIAPGSAGGGDGNGGITENELAKLDNDDLATLIRIKRKLIGDAGDKPVSGGSTTGASAA